MTSKLVWSTSVGYPADFNYREYYRDIGFDLPEDYLEPFQYAKGIRTHTGIKYHRITGKGNDKHLYNPDWAVGTVQRHAQDFVQRCLDQARRDGNRMPLPAVIVSPYDAELFGHWWFEGPQWVYHVLRNLAACDDLKTGTPGEFLTAHPIQQKALPATSSWGRNGYSEHWVNPKTAWMWRPLHEAAARMSQAVGHHAVSPNGASNGHHHHGNSLTDRVLRQAGRELMLAQASDWPFIITNGTTEQYARRRFHDHVNRFHDLLHGLDHDQVDPRKLEALEYMDNLFPELNYRLFAD